MAKSSSSNAPPWSRRFPGSYYPAAAIEPEQGNLAKAITAVLHDCILLSRILRSDTDKYHRFLQDVGPSRSRGMFLSHYIIPNDLKHWAGTEPGVLTLPHPRWQERFRKYGFDALVDLVNARARLTNVYWMDKPALRATVSSRDWVLKSKKDIICAAIKVKWSIEADVEVRQKINAPVLPAVVELQRIVEVPHMVFDVNLENLYNSVSATPPQTGLAQTLAKFSGSDEMKLLVQILDGIKALSRGMHNSEAHSELLSTLPIGGATDASLAVYYRLEWGNLLLFIRDIVCGLLDGPSMLTYNTAVKIYLGMLVKIFGDNGGATSEIVLLALMTLLNSFIRCR